MVLFIYRLNPNQGRAVMRTIMDFQIGSIFVRVVTSGAKGHLHISIIAPIGKEFMANVKLHFSNEKDTQPLTGTLRTYERGEIREETIALDI